MVLFLESLLLFEWKSYTLLSGSVESYNLGRLMLGLVWPSFYDIDDAKSLKLNNEFKRTRSLD